MRKNIVHICFLYLFSCLVLTTVWAEGLEAKVSSADELKVALANPNVQLVRLVSEFVVESDEEAPGTLIFDRPVVVEAPVSFIFTTVVNKSRLTIRSKLKFGAAILLNYGSLRVEKDGALNIFMSNLDNQDTVFVLPDAEILVDRGGKVQNSGIMVNRGVIRVTDNGASLSTMENSILDNYGKILLDGYFNNNNALFLGDLAWLKKLKK